MTSPKQAELFNEAVEKLNYFFIPEQSDSLLFMRIQDAESFVPGTASDGYHTINFNPELVDTTSKISFITKGSGFQVPDKTKLEIILPEAYNYLYGMLISRFKATSPVSTCYLRAIYKYGIDYGSNTILGLNRTYNVPFTMEIPFQFFQRGRRYSNSDQGAKLCIETYRENNFDNMTLLLFAKQYEYNE